MSEGLIIALIFLAGLSPLFWRFYVQHRWVPTQGTVVKNTVYPNKGQRRAAGYHYPSVEFTANGQTHVFESRWRKRATKSPRFSVGDSVETTSATMGGLVDEKKIGVYPVKVNHKLVIRYY